MNANEVYLQWKENLSQKQYPNLYSELEKIGNNPKELEERFYKELRFGTAGLRGKLGVGTNRMNELVVGRVTKGIANFIAKKGESYLKRGMVIAYDCRHFSKEFAILVAEILATHKIHVYIFESLRATPELSYAIRKLGAIGGINVTASHNPKEYNGYKVYWKDGAQITDELANAMQREIMEVDLFDHAQRMDFQSAVATRCITILSKDMDRSYLELVQSLAIRDGECLDKDISIVYTPLNGAGYCPVKTIVHQRGFRNVYIVPEQEKPDPDFTSVGYPNPEDSRVFALAKILGKQVGAEVLIATDPDSDRMAIEIRDTKGEYRALSGNQTGVLLIHYLLEGLKETSGLPSKGFMIKSIVTGDMGTAICESYGVKMFESLTGFKNICGRIPELQNQGMHYLMGYEESIGYALSEEVRDKDGISATMRICEAAAYYKNQGKTLLEVLDELYKEYGYYKEEQVSLVLEGMEGTRRIADMMQEFRAYEGKSFGGFPITQAIDYQNGYKDIGRSNVLKYILDGGHWFAIRPSGTEPKIKLYIYTKAEEEKVALIALSKIKEDIVGRLKQVM